MKATALLALIIVASPATADGGGTLFGVDLGMSSDARTGNGVSGNYQIVYTNTLAVAGTDPLQVRFVAYWSCRRFSGRKNKLGLDGDMPPTIAEMFAEALKNQEANPKRTILQVIRESATWEGEDSACARMWFAFTEG